MQTIIWLAIPAIVALVIKIALFFYAQQSINRLTRWYLVFLFFLGLMNIGEIWHFVALNQDKIPFYSMHLYYFGLALSLPTFLRLAFEVSYQDTPAKAIVLCHSLAGAAVVLGVLLFTTPWVISGYTRLGFSATRIPGPLFPVLEAMLIGCVAGSIVLFVRGVVKHDSPRMQLMNAYMIVAFLPMAVVAVTIMVALRMFDMPINAAVLAPVAITIFLCVTAYATHNHKLFDISFCIPRFVNRRTRHTETQLSRLLSELPDTIPRALLEIARAVNSPVALIGNGDPVVMGGNMAFTGLTRDDLGPLSTFTGTHQVRSAALRNKLEENDIGFVAPFSPEKDVMSWFVFGGNAKDTIATAESFKLAAHLCERINAYYGTDFVAYKTMLQDVQEQLDTLINGDTGDQPGALIRPAAAPATPQTDVSVAVVSADPQQINRLAMMFPRAQLHRKRSDGIEADIIYADLGSFSGHDIRTWRKYTGALIWIGEGKQKRDLFTQNLAYGDKYYTWVDADWLRDEAGVISFHRELKQMQHALVATGCPGDVEYYYLSNDDAYLEALARIDASIQTGSHLIIGSSADRQETIETLDSRIAKHTQQHTQGATEIIRSVRKFPGISRSLRDPANVLSAIISFIPPSQEIVDLACTRSVALLEIKDEKEGVDVVYPAFEHRLNDKIMYGRWVEGPVCMSTGSNPLPVEELRLLTGSAQSAESVRESVIGHHCQLNSVLPAGATTLTEAVDRYELSMIRKALTETNNKAQAARMLGIRSNTLHYKIEHHGLDEPTDRNG